MRLLKCYRSTGTEHRPPGQGTQRMRLKVIDTRLASERDSDYETAVKLVHWSMASQRTLFETPRGVRLVVESRQELTSRSYLEPDFDTLDATGALVYLERTASEPSVCRETKALHGLYVAQPIPSISRERFQAVFATPSLGIDATAWDIYFSEEVDAGLREAVAAFLAGEDGRPAAAQPQFGDTLVRLNTVRAHLGEGDLDLLLQVEADPGAAVDCQVSVALESAVALAELLHTSIEASNRVVAAENRVAAALARIEVLIDNLVAAASFQVHLGFRGLARKDTR